MNTTLTIFAIALIVTAFTPPSDFLTQQKQYERVRIAISEKQAILERTLTANGLEPDNLNILLIACKDEDELDIYAKKKTENTYRKLTSYRICSRSGQLGPKRKEGDYQVPEGFYHINMFNPSSNFLLSLGINYPNLSDQRKSTAAHLGGNIFIHGACVTIGCLPMTNDGIKEIYLYAVHAKNSGQASIPVYIFPFRMTDANFIEYKTKFSHDRPLMDFWSNLKTGYDQFMAGKKQLRVIVDAHGDYGFKP
jgi:murein L,D-transpeptidase YafK